MHCISKYIAWGSFARNGQWIGQQTECCHCGQLNWPEKRYQGRNICSCSCEAAFMLSCSYFCMTISEQNPDTRISVTELKHVRPHPLVVVLWGGFGEQTGQNKTIWVKGTALTSNLPKPWGNTDTFRCHFFFACTQPTQTFNETLKRSVAFSFCVDMEHRHSENRWKHTCVSG